MDRRIIVESMVDYPVGLTIDGGRFHRVFQKEGARQHIPYEELYDGLSEYGVAALFSEGLLRVVDEKDQIDLGLATKEITEVNGKEEEKVVENVKTFTTGQITTLLKLKSLDDIKEAFVDLPDGQKEKFAKTAIDLKVTDYEKCEFLKKETGIDVIKAIQLEQDNKK